MEGGNPEFKMQASQEGEFSEVSSMKTYREAAEYGIDVGQLEFLLTLTPAQRLRRHDAALALVRAAREAGIQHYGFDPRSPGAA
jgi:hypothetical protein